MAHQIHLVRDIDTRDQEDWPLQSQAENDGSFLWNSWFLNQKASSQSIISTQNPLKESLTYGVSNNKRTLKPPQKPLAAPPTGLVVGFTDLLAKAKPNTAGL